MFFHIDITKNNSPEGAIIWGFMMKNSVCVSLIMVFCISVSAKNIAYEGFGYPNTQSVNNKQGGFGWNGAWQFEQTSLKDSKSVETLLLFNQPLSLFSNSNLAHSVSCGRMSRRLYLPMDPVFDRDYYFSFFLNIAGKNEASLRERLSLMTLRNTDNSILVSVEAAPEGFIKLVLGAGEIQSEQKYLMGQTYFIVAKLKVRRQGMEDSLHVSLYSDMDQLKADTKRWQASLSSQVNGCSYSYEYGTGTSGQRLIVDEIKIATELSSVMPGEEVLQSSVTDKVYHSLEYDENAVYHLNRGFSKVSILPWSGAKIHDIILTDRGNYLQMPNAIYHSAGFTTHVVCSLSSAGLPLYDAGHPFEPLATSGPYSAVPRQNGTFDIIDIGAKVYYEAKSDTSGSPEFNQNGYKLNIPSSNSIERYGDIDGDGIVDVLISHLIKEQWGDYWPNPQGPWSTEDQPDLGSSRDYENIGRARGYDVLGNWLGKKLTSKLYWAKGKRDTKGKLTFLPKQPVYLGTEDYQVQWRDWDFRPACPGVLTLGSERYILWFGGINKLIAMKILSSNDGRLHVGKARPLLEDGYELWNTHLANIAFTGDMDGDGTPEVVLDSGADGSIIILKGREIGKFKNAGRICATGGGIVASNTLVTPCRGDWDKDGILDLIIGDASGYVWLYPGTKEPIKFASPTPFKVDGKILQRIPGCCKSLQGPEEALWGYIQPTVADWNEDGQLDIITNDSSAELILYERKNEALDELRQTFFTFRGNLLQLAWRSRPAVLDGRYHFAGDDRHCILFLDDEGDLAVAVPKFIGGTDIERIEKLVDEKGLTMRLCGPHDGLWGRTKFTTVDWNNDGKWDIVFGGQGTITKWFVPDWQDVASPYWMKNIGSNSRPVFAPPKLITLKDGSIISAGKHNFSVWPTDINDDGNLDIIAGVERGEVLLFYHEELDWQ